MQAREHYKQGTKLYDLRRYREAAREYELAYEAKEDSALLFNIAQAYRFAGAYEESIASYRSYLRHVPKSGNRAEVEKRIAEMQELAAAQKRQLDAPPNGTILEKIEPAKPEPAKPEPPPVVEPVPPPKVFGPSEAQLKRGRQEKIAGIALVAVGLASFGVGAGMAVLAKQASDQVSRAPQFDASVERRGQLDQGLAIGLFALGGAAVGTGVALWLVGRHESRRNSFVLAPAIGLAYAGVEGRF